MHDEENGPTEGAPLERTVPDASGWPDAWLVAAVRRDPPDEAALDALVGRYWKRLVGRCRLLTASAEEASDLAQDTWVRVLRARGSLHADGNFAGYLATVATNLWRDRCRASRRAGALAEHRMASLDAEMPSGDGDTVVLGESLADLASLGREDRVLLALDVDRALAQLAPRLREVLVARFIDGESAAEIGARYGRTEQSVTSWIRQAIREMRQHLGETPSADTARSATTERRAVADA